MGWLGLGKVARQGVKAVTGSKMPLVDTAMKVADKYMENKNDKRAFVERAFDKEVEDVQHARVNNRNSKTPEILTYLTFVAAMGLGAAFFTPYLNWRDLSEIQKEMIVFFTGFFLRSLGDVYTYWFGGKRADDVRPVDFTKFIDDEKKNRRPIFGRRKEKEDTDFDDEVV